VDQFEITFCRDSRRAFRPLANRSESAIKAMANIEKNKNPVTNPAEKHELSCCAYHNSLGILMIRRYASKIPVTASNAMRAFLIQPSSQAVGRGARVNCPENNVTSEEGLYSN
jgi:hypothetical protein